MKQFVSFTLDEHIIIGNVLKVLRNELNRRYVELSHQRGKTDSLVKRFKKAVDGLDTTKSLMDDVMFHDHPQASDDYLKAYYGRYPERIPENLNDLKKLTGLG